MVGGGNLSIKEGEEVDSIEAYKKLFRDRLVRLCMDNHYSERELSLAMGKSPAFIHNATSGVALPQMENFFLLCKYLDVTPAEFFDPDISHSNLSREVLVELTRLCSGDLQRLLKILKTLKPEQVRTLLDLLEK